VPEEEGAAALEDPGRVPEEGAVALDAPDTAPEDPLAGADVEGTTVAEVDGSPEEEAPPEEAAPLDAPRPVPPSAVTPHGSPPSGKGATAGLGAEVQAAHARGRARRNRVTGAEGMGSPRRRWEVSTSAGQA
jgi:hypothetical protein